MSYSEVTPFGSDEWEEPTGVEKKVRRQTEIAFGGINVWRSADLFTMMKFLHGHGYTQATKLIDKMNRRANKSSQRN